MSNDVYGYVQLREHAAPSVLEEALVQQAHEIGLGCRILSSGEVYGLPERHAPPPASVCFRISDAPESTAASYLIDMEDYVPGAELHGLPLRGIDRVKRLIDWIDRIAALPSTALLLVAASDDNEVERVVALASAELGDRLLADFAECAPPNRAYLVKP